MNNFRVKIVDENENIEIFTDVVSVKVDDTTVKVTRDENVDIFYTDGIQSVNIEIDR